MITAAFLDPTSPPCYNPRVKGYALERIRFPVSILSQHRSSGEADSLLCGVLAHVAQPAEHVLGKNGVTSSSLVVGFDSGSYVHGTEEV